MIAFLLSPLGRLAIAGVIGASIGFGGAWKVQGWRLDSEKAAFSAFKAQVDAEGKASEIARQKDISDRKAISNKQEADNAKRYASLDTRYRAALAAARVPNSGGSASEPLSSAATVLNCPGGQPDLAGRLADLETGILGLLQRGDKAIERTITCKAWLDDQIAK